MALNATFKVLLIAGIIATCLGSGIFYYTQVTSKPVVSSTSQLKAAEFFVSNLTVNPSEVEVGQPVKVSVNVTNFGQQDGNYSVDIQVNNAFQDSKGIELSGGQNATVAFTLTESNSGTYIVRIGTYLYNLSDQGTIYTVGTNLGLPVSATNNGKNVLPQISKIDGNSTVATRWKWNTLDLSLGNLEGVSQKLLINAQTNWPTNEAGGNWATQFSNQPGVTPSPPPYMEVKDAKGNWVKVPDNREFPIPPVDPSLFTVNLTGLFQTNDYSLRICYYQDYTFDYIGVDTTSQQSVNIQEILPKMATLGQDFGTDSNSTGSFTRYGNVDNLLLAADDMYVIGGQGDSVQLEFAKAAPVPNGMVRDYFIVASCWFKGQGLPYVPFTVNVLPFHNMTGYPYPSTEKYPMDPSHNSYLSQYNTRSINTTKTNTAGQMTSVIYNQIDIAKLFVTNTAFLIPFDYLSLSSAFRSKK